MPVRGSQHCDERHWIMDFKYYYVVRCIQAVLALGGNGLTMVSIIKFDYLRSATNMFVFSLALSDFFTGLFTPLAATVFFTRPLEISTRGTERDISLLGNADNRTEQLGSNTTSNANDFSEWLQLCFAKELAVIFQSSGSISGIFLITIDRFLFVEKPLRYYSLMDERKALVACFIMWTITVVSGPVTLSFFLRPMATKQCDTSTWSTTYLYGVSMPLFAAISVTTVVLYLRIALVACRKQNAVAPALPSGQSAEHREKLNKGNKVTKMLSIVLGLYFVFYLPSIAFGAVDDKNSSFFLALMKYLSYLLWYCAMCVNPFTYAWKSKEFRKAFWHLLKIKYEVETENSSSY